MVVLEQVEREAEPDDPDVEYDSNEDVAEGEEGYQGFFQLDHQGGQQEQNIIVISIRLFLFKAGVKGGLRGRVLYFTTKLTNL